MLFNPQKVCLLCTWLRVGLEVLLNECLWCYEKQRYWQIVQLWTNFGITSFQIGWFKSNKVIWIGKILYFRLQVVSQRWRHVRWSNHVVRYVKTGLRLKKHIPRSISEKVSKIMHFALDMFTSHINCTVLQTFEKIYPPEIGNNIN